MDTFMDINFLFIFKNQPSTHLFFGAFTTNNLFPYLIFLKFILAAIDFGYKISGNDLAWLNLALSFIIILFYSLGFSDKKKNCLWLFDTLFILVRITFFFSNNISYFMCLTAKLISTIGTILGFKPLEIFTKNTYGDSIFLSVFLIFLDFHFNFCFYSMMKIQKKEISGEINSINQDEKPLEMFDKPAVSYRFVHPDILEIVTRIKYKALGGGVVSQLANLHYRNQCDNRITNINSTFDSSGNISSAPTISNFGYH
jgi:hypothetical protein